MSVRHRIRRAVVLLILSVVSLSKDTLGFVASQSASCDDARQWWYPNTVRPSFSTRIHALPTPEESAQQLTEYMAKAHEEKIRAIQDVEKKCQDKIHALQNRLDQLEGRAPLPSSAEVGSFDMPATNKALTKKIEQYRDFLSKYVVQSQVQRVRAVAQAEKKLRDHYEAVIEELKKGQEGSSAVVKPEIVEKKSFQ